MNARIRILLALLGCLVFGGNALSADLGHCDPICCDEPCEAVPLEPEVWDGGAVGSPSGIEPRLPAGFPMAPEPALLPELVVPPAPPALAALTGFNPAPAPLPAPPRASVLRL